MHDGETDGDIIASILHCCTALRPTFGVFVVFGGDLGWVTIGITGFTHI